jgi:3-deoxy-manno-octulosonate cytidylyltransferase (CMP-KDO synthetase)
MYFFQREFLLQYATLKETSLEQAEKLEQLRIIENGYDIKAAVTRYDSVPVDTPQDLERVRAIYSASYERG